MKELIDHTILRPTTTTAEIERLCKEAIEHGFYAVCVPPFYVVHAHHLLSGSGVKLATVIGYPYGYAETPVKVAEARRAIDDGADELDFVVNLAAIKSGDWDHVRSDIEQMVTTTRLRGKVAKIIIEIAELNEDERGRVVTICNDVEPHFVKTSTGTRGGASVEDVRYLRTNLKASIKIKASGGIRTPEDADRLVAAGANRIGTSAGIAVAGYNHQL